MREYTFRHEGHTYKRINKAVARTVYNMGLSVMFIPCNLRPFTPWRNEYITKKDAEPEERTFDRLCNELEWYGCRDRETGYYLAYYIPVRTVDRFTGETPTDRTLGTVEEYDYTAIRWETWTAKGVAE